MNVNGFSQKAPDSRNPGKQPNDVLSDSMKLQRDRRERQPERKPAEDPQIRTLEGSDETPDRKITMSQKRINYHQSEYGHSIASPDQAIGDLSRFGVYCKIHNPKGAHLPELDRIAHRHHESEEFEVGGARVRSSPSPSPTKDAAQREEKKGQRKEGERSSSRKRYNSNQAVHFCQQLTLGDRTDVAGKRIGNVQCATPPLGVRYEKTEIPNEQASMATTTTPHASGIGGGVSSSSTMTTPAKGMTACAKVLAHSGSKTQTNGFGKQSSSGSNTNAKGSPTKKDRIGLGCCNNKAGCKGNKGPCKIKKHMEPLRHLENDPINECISKINSFIQAAFRAKDKDLNRFEAP